MNNILWLIFWLCFSALVAFSSVIFDENSEELIVIAILSTTYSVYLLLSDRLFRYSLSKKLKYLSGKINNLKQLIYKHKSEPHIIASAVIELSSTLPQISCSYGVVDVVCSGTGKFSIIVEHEYSSHLVPNVDSDFEYSPKISISEINGRASVDIEWSDKEPKFVYFSLSK